MLAYKSQQKTIHVPLLKMKKHISLFRPKPQLVHKPELYFNSVLGMRLIGLVCALGKRLQTILTRLSGSLWIRRKHPMNRSWLTELS
jgi:hypothetical protein